jgi:putative spermidine/putrescine transport system substrate-binding protein
MKPTPGPDLHRRRLVHAAGAALAMPTFFVKSAAAAEPLVVRTPGGARDDVLREVLYEPFKKDTGFEIVTATANSSKLVAMVNSGRPEIDVVDITPITIKRLEQINGVEPIPYGEFKYTNPEDIAAPLRTKFSLASSTYATVIGYDVNAFAGTKAPKSWAEFWDVKAFPGRRALGGLEANAGDLEMALLADGVAMDKLYPLDLDRAFKSLTRIRPDIVKFWESGAMSTQMLTDREVVLTSIWSSRLSLALDKGAPLAANWNQCRVEIQSYGILKGAKNMVGAKKFVDYASSADMQKRIVQKMGVVPSNDKARSAMPKWLIDPATNTPWTVSRGFIMDADYWAQNIGTVVDRWSKWIIR